MNLPEYLRLQGFGRSTEGGSKGGAASLSPLPQGRLLLHPQPAPSLPGLQLQFRHALTSRPSIPCMHMAQLLRDSVSRQDGLPKLSIPM